MREIGSAYQDKRKASSSVRGAGKPLWKTNQDLHIGTLYELGGCS